MHPYPGGAPPEPVLAANLREPRRDSIAEGVVFTETGYHNALEATTGQPPTSEKAAAAYLPRLLLAAFGSGVRRTFVYELIDEKPEAGLQDQEQHFGLLRNDLSRKPAFEAIRTLIAALEASPGAASSEGMWWSLRVPGDEKVERLSMVRRDGSRLLALWRPVAVWDRDARRAVTPETSSVEVVFDSLARDVVVWRPSVSASPVLRRDFARRLPLELEGDVVLVSLR